MKRLIQKLLIGGIITCTSLTINAQVKYIYLSISQPNVEECITGIENTFKDCDLKIFPNPNKGIFTLEIINRSPVIQMDLSIYDITGKELLIQQLRINEKLRKTIDLSGYNAGTYILNVKGVQNTVFKAKLIIY
ncbi:MAG: T9SS type A sorting domain-containing protein [Bacteroidota bacterium]